MTDQTPTAANLHDHDEGPAPDIRPIPDGGLGSAMPDWMRQTPSWKRPAEPAVVRPMPPADTSTIDPRQLIDIDDLPQWLRAVAAREPGSLDVPVPPAPSSPPPAADAGTARLDAIVTDVERPRTSPGTWLPVPGNEGSVERPDHVRLAPSPLGAEPPWWMSDAVIAFLFVAIVLTLIYVILAAAGVV